MLSITFPIAAAIANLFAIIIVLLRTRDRGVKQSFVLVTAALAAWNLQLPLESAAAATGHYLGLLHWIRALAFFVPATIFHTAFECAGGRRRQRSTLLWLGYAIALTMALLQTREWVCRGFVIYSWGAVPRPGMLFPVMLAFSFGWMMLGVIACARSLRHAPDPVVRLRSKYWLLAAASAFPLWSTHVFATYGWPVLPIWSSGSFSVVALITYSVVRRRLVDLDVFLTKASAVLVATLVLALPVAGVMIWTLHSALNLFNCVVLGLLTMAGIVTASIFPDFRSHLERGIENTLFPARRTARGAILQFSLNVVKLPCRADLGKQLVLTLCEGLYLRGAALYVQAEKVGEFTLACAHGDIQAPHLVQAHTLLDASGPSLVRLADESTAPATQLAAQNVGWEACVPVWAETTCLALIALAAKGSGGDFSDTDITLLTVVSAQLAVALKNADYVREIECQKTAIEELQRRLEAENVSLRAEVQSVSQFKEIIGSSRALQRVLGLVERAAPSDASILITGETGTGKELIARAIHELSPRRQGPLISVNCSAIPPALAESELFGHERGAFTDAVSAQPGKFELADGGTIFLDEIGDLPLELQGKLLRVLQEHVVQRVGGHKTQRLDLRVVAATNRDLHAELQAQRFREDLYYRLATVVVHVPPLRERVEDIPMLAGYFVERAAATHQRTIKGFTRDAIDALCRYSWPGNIRELQNVVERAVLLCTSEIIRPEYLSDVSAAPRKPFGRAIREEKRLRIERALAETGGNQAAAARLLGITPSNLARLIKSVGAKFPESLQ